MVWTSSHGSEWGTGRLILCILVCLALAQGAVAADASPPLTTETLAGYASRWLKAEGPRSDEAAAALDAAARWLILDAASLRMDGGAITWKCIPRRALTLVEQTEAVKSLEALLLQILVTPPGGVGTALRSPDEARRLMDQCIVTLDRPPPSRSVLSLSPDEVTTVIEAYIATLARQGKLSTRELATASSVCEFRGERLGAYYDMGALTWNVRPKSRSLNREPRSEREYERMLQQAREFVAPALPGLARLARAALSTQPHPDFGRPLLTEDQTLTVRIKLEPMLEIAAACAPAGIHILRAAPSKGAADRTISAVAESYATRIETAGTAEERLGFDYQPGDSVDEQPRLILDPQGYSGAVVNALAFSPDGRWLAAGGEVVRIWDLQTGAPVHTLRGATKFGGVGGCTDLAFSPDGRQLLVAVHGFRLSLRVYDTADFSEIQDALAGHDGHIDRLAISRDGQWIATAGIDQHVHVWDWQRYKKVRSYRFRYPIDHLSFPSTDPYFLAINVKGSGAHERATGDAPARRTDVFGALQTAFSRPWPDDGRPHPFALSLALDRQRYAAGGISRLESGHRYWCGVWSLDQAEPLQVHDHPYLVTACALSRDLQWVASADAQGGIHVWSADTGKVRHRLISLARPNYSVAFGPTEAQFLVGRFPHVGDDWRPNHYGPLTDGFDLLKRRFDSRAAEKPAPARLQQNGRELSLDSEGGGRTIRVRREGAVESSLPFKSPANWWPLCFSFLQSRQPGFPDPVIIGSESGSLGCFEPTQLLLRRTFLGHTDRVWSVAESSCGRYLASASGDGTVRIWSLSDFRPWGNLAAYCDEAGEVFHVVPGTPTAQAQVREGDRIASIAWHDPEELALALGRQDWPLKAGKVEAVTLEREGEQIEKKIELSNMGDLVQPLLNLFVTSDGREWIVWTPGGYYDCSPRADRLLGWQVNRQAHESARFYQVAQFRDRYYRPDVIDLVLTTGSEREAVRLADARRTPAPPSPAPAAPQVASVTPPAATAELLAELQPPLVTIVQPPGETLTGASEIELQAEVRVLAQRAAPEVQVLVNGRTLDARQVERLAEQTPRGLQLLPNDLDPPRDRWLVRRTVPLVPGRNEISVVAWAGAARNLATSARTYVTSRRQETSAPTLYVLAVGISRFANAAINLRYADRDAEEFVEFCKTQQGPLYGRVEPRLLVNEQATVDQIKDAMDWLARQVTSRDTLILFLASHGVLDENGNYYLLTHQGDKDRLRATCLRWSDFQQLRYDLRGCGFVMFVDTCHSGGISEPDALGSQVQDELFNERLGATVYAACSARSVSLEDAKWQHGAFTKAILDTVRNVDGASDLSATKDGLLSLAELALNLGDRVGQLTERRQVPAWARPETGPDVPLFQLPPTPARSSAGL
jgi:WD40 repeat protein